MFKHNDFSVIHTGKLIIKEFLFVDIVYPWFYYLFTYILV